MEFAPFGNTGHRSSRVIFGAAALGGMSQERANATLELVQKAGINHIDTAASYGESELRLAPWLRTNRKNVFLATKTGERSGVNARAELERSLERLGVDHVDLVQLHNLVEPDEWDEAHGIGGAVEALNKARDEGLVRFIGVTGHGLRIAEMHARSLERFSFDSVLFPWSYVLAQISDYRANVERLLAMCTDRGVAVQTIKAIARRRWSSESDASAKRFSWYEPVRDPDVLARCVGWVLDDERLFLNSTSDATLLPLVFDAANNALNNAANNALNNVPVSGNTSITQLQAARMERVARLEVDALAHGMRPLFDGAALERI